MKRIERRARATQDLEDAFGYYIDFTEVSIAERFMAEVERAFRHISQHPGTGSARYSSLPNGDQLRFWTLNKFPYAVFYLERLDYIEIVRVLHQASDIPSHLEP